MNISLLDDYIKNILSKTNNLCKNCKKKESIQICQFCRYYFCKECYSNHLTVEHILKNTVEIYENNNLDNLEKDEKCKTVKEKIEKSIQYLKKIEKYYKELENNFKKFMIDNMNELKLINTSR